MNIKDKIEQFLTRFSFFHQREENEPVAPVERDERKAVRFGMLTIVIGFGGFMLWAALAPLDEGVPATGVVSVDTKRKTIQHLRGGIVETIEVREGATVKAGDVLLRLNNTDIQAQVDITRGQYSVAKAIQSRLLAERNGGLKQVVFPNELLETAKADARIADAIMAQSKLFSARKSALESEIGTMVEAERGLNEQIRGLESVQMGKTTQIDLINKELASYRGLVDDGFVPRNKLYELERVVAELSGTRGSDIAQIARAKSSISELSLRKLQRQQDYRKEVEGQLADVQREVDSLSDKLNAMTEELERTVIRAPISGSVVGLDANTIGGVIRSGDRIMDIVPDGDVLVVEAQLPVNLINKVQVGQLAIMHLQIVLSGGAAPAIEGKLVQVSADRLTDPKNSAPYYSARIQITPNGEAELRKNKIIPQAGMQTDVVIRTGERTVLQYLLNPLMQRISHGMTEH